MRWFHSALLSPLFFVVLTSAFQVNNHYPAGFGERDKTLTLFPRVRTGPNGEILDPKTADDLFLLHDGAGGCRSHEDTLNAWVTEAMQLHAAIEELYRNVRNDGSKAILWMAWFGLEIDKDIKDIDMDDDFNAQIWNTIGDHIARVSRFFAGGGLENPQVPGEKPRIFCGPEAGTVQSWAKSVVKDRDGQDVVASEDPDTGIKTYLRLWDAFPTWAEDENARAFWFETFKGYDVDFKGHDTLCHSDLENGRKRYAKTARPTSSWPSIAVPHAEFEFGKANRHILLCPPAFNPDPGAHSYRSLAEAIDEDNYPIAGLRDQDQALDRMLPVSATLYHELYHLTDADNTRDTSYHPNEIQAQARNTEYKVGNSHNPETFTYVAMAAYLLIHAPAGEEPCLYLSAFPVRKSSALHRASSGPSSPEIVDDVVTALDNLRGFTLSAITCDETIKFAYSQSVAVGVYSGSGLAGQGTLAQALDLLITQIRNDGSIEKRVAVEMCSSSLARYSLGIMIDTTGDIGTVQRAVQNWNNGTCTSPTQSRGAAAAWGKLSYLAPMISNGTVTDSAKRSWRRAECQTIQVEGGDTCTSLAAECGITLAQFTEYNPDADCNSLQRGQHLCCSAGTLPDFRPQPDENGYCFAYLVKTGDDCSQLAATNGITKEQIEEFNKDTWGWNGCDKMFADYNICLSPGYPPMPAPIPNAVCGPQVNDIAKAPPGTDLRTLNQCPLNACCNIWGQCGTTGEFCTESESATGAPGTAAPGENGCISNCGTDIIIGESPGETYNIAYFEAWSWERPCLRMSVNMINTSAYTHIHYSFVELNEDFSINIEKAAHQFPLFLGIRGVKKIVAVGGWAFSTEPETYHIFRKAVTTPESRNTLVTNIIDFLEEYDLDGVDWDWEYPAEPDIPGIPPGDEDEATGFFLLLSELKGRLPAGKTSSVTGPASFWYLQYFPVDAIAMVTDYLVFMTYDLHGQWDYINKYATPGCPSYDNGLGNCLRSHVNLTETVNALSMITKAGVPSTMTVVGVSSYGRSFEMSAPGCWTEQCTYTGPESGAFPGRCTETAGYISDYEIGEILRTNPTAQDLWDEGSYSDIVVFNETQWVAYMKKDNKETRKGLYPTLNFLGTADWAVDLQSENGGAVANDDEDSSSSGGTYYIDPKIWDAEEPVVTAPPGASLIWPPMPLARPTTITFEDWTTSITYSSLASSIATLPDGTFSTSRWYEVESWLTVLTILPLTTSAIPVWGVTLDKSSTDEGVAITLTSSVQPPPFPVSVTPVLSGTTSIVGATETTTITHDPVVWDSTTYTPRPETWTLGGTTIIKGGMTLPSTEIIVTPNPHPTRTPDPDDEDPALNSKTPTVSPGKPPSPTAPPDCPGCGLPCLDFCNPACPYCPPGMFGPPGRGGGSNNDNNDDDDDDDDDDNDEEDDPDHTILYVSLSDDLFPTAMADPAALSSMHSIVMSDASKLFGISTTTTTTKPTTTTTTARPPDPTPTADCMFWDTILFYTFEIYNIDDWAEQDGGDALRDEEEGCGAIAHWDWNDETDDTYAYVYFTLPFFIKEGCVERVIVSAGGPKLSCKGGGIGPPVKRNFGNQQEESRDENIYGHQWYDHSRAQALEARDDGEKQLSAPVFPPFSDEVWQECRAFYEVLNEETGIQAVEEHNDYIPMTWGGNGDPGPTAAARL
ncbi:class V chitinase Chi100 [Aspergillus terreus]|uniref:chitinase n=1 Tax=Aspergillus terreus TaxID=33178 RepID=A0A5M3Z7U8_ASPTE|nr:hypothetical protein ATETN484_0011027600 [Aspergillus terreus]GFF18913.1 class V chitinase Chi100 [Aspergillus terreus]